jgi:F-type H+-transporting ATPase subunit epsilon
MGYVGILANHAPFITTLGPGKIVIRDGAGKTEAYPSDSGFLEILDNKATILLDSIEDKA